MSPRQSSEISVAQLTINAVGIGIIHACTYVDGLVIIDDFHLGGKRWFSLIIGLVLIKIAGCNGLFPGTVIQHPVNLWWFAIFSRFQYFILIRTRLLC